MRAIRLAFALCVWATVITTPLRAQSKGHKNDAVQEFRQYAAAGVEMCDIAREIAQVGGNDSVLTKSIGDSKKLQKSLYAKAVARLAGKPGSISLLKEYYALWLSEIESVKPRENELNIVYQQRRGEATRRAEDAWHRFEIESGY